MKVQDLNMKEQDLNNTFHTDFTPGHVEISPSGAISLVTDWDKLPEQSKKSKIQTIKGDISKEITEKALKAQWRDICNIYLEEFCKKHEYKYDPDMWIGNDPGTIVEVCDMFVKMDDIRYDVDNNVPEEYFEKWYWKGLDVYELTGENYMNYQSYCKGAPDKWTDEALDRVREARKRVDKARLALLDEIERLKNKK